MSGSPERDREAVRWFLYAEEDLATAQMVLEHDGPLRQACALAQQAAEKALKAALVSEGHTPPRSHNLTQILRLLPETYRLKAAGLKLSGLSEWAVAARYPGDWEEPTPAEAHDAVELAGQVLQSIREDLRGL